METVNIYELEPQTADYQAAVDNVWFENIGNASSLRASWNWKNSNQRFARWDYMWDLQEQMCAALGVRKLGYTIDNI